MSTGVERGTEALIEQIDAPIASYFNSCVHCGLCADACLFYTETRDPKYTPIHKVEPLRRAWWREHTFWGRLAKAVGLSKPLSDRELAQWEELLYDSCTLCGRCTLVCPVGNDITYMIRKTREGMVAAGHAPAGLIAATVRSVEIGSPMGATVKTLKAQIRHAEAETGLRIPLDVQGAECMMLLSSAEVVHFPESIGALARIFDRAGVSWTFCSEAFDATNSGYQLGSRDLAGQLLNRIVVAAERLGVKYVLSPECGHAYTVLRWEGPNIIGRPFGFEVLHITELLDRLRREGRLVTEGMETERLTYHDPCQNTRRGGLPREPRDLLALVAEGFVEMEDHGVWNWCCGGGGGVAANERAVPLRMEAFRRKKRQLDATGVHTLVTTCSNCRLMLEEGLEHYNMDIKVIGMVDLIASHLPEAKPADGVPVPGASES